MLYLAQVHKNEFLDQPQLRLLARREAENMWVTIPEEAFILLGKGNTSSENLLVLVKLSPTGDIERLEEATNWVLEMVLSYLTTGITPEFLRQEAERAEQWRQNLTLQNQDLARRSLELEARREQIQALEESLKRERLDLEARREPIQALEESLKREKLDLEARREQVQALEESLQREKLELSGCREQIQALEESLKRQKNGVHKEGGAGL